jgi:uncharacterized protein (TIGR04141 family)
MAKSRGFSIYLLKDTFSPVNALKDDHNLELLTEDNTNLPNGSILYLADNPGSAPWWKNYWGLHKSLYQVQKGALVFLPVSNRWVALTFGMTYHQLKDNSYEYDFGLRTTLNALDPQKIKSTDILQPENAKRQRIQSPTASNLNFFDIRYDESIIKKLTGAVKSEYHDLFKNATGADSLRISSNLQPNQIVGLCSRLIEIYNKTDYITSFPDIQNIVPVKDPDKILLLNQKLIEEFGKATIELVLSIPEIIDYLSSFKIKYSGAGRSKTEYDDVYIGDYRNYLLERNITEITDVNTLMQHQMKVIDENGDDVKSYNIYKCLLFDCVVEGNTYHLTEGEWYKIDSDYIQKLANAINPHFITTHPFLHDCEKVREDDYNISVSEANTDVLCLDKTNISPVGQTAVEPCDLITVLDNKIDLIHIKISTRSSSLSHLFNQGVNSIEMLRLEEESREKLRTLVDGTSIAGLIDSGLYSVTYGIVTRKTGASEKLPIFSRMSLLRAINSLKVMNIQCSIFFIKDNVERKKIKPVE